MIPPASDMRLLGTAEVTPTDPVPAGSWGEWRIRYVVPPSGIDDGGALRVAVRYASDWARPQTDDPTGDNYVSASCSRPDTTLTCRWMERGNVRPYMPYLWIVVTDAPLENRDEILITWGDRSGGGKGSRVQTFVQDQFDFQVSVDRFGTGLYEPLPAQPWIPVVPNAPHRLVVICSGDGSAQHPARVLIRAEDTWGNPVKEDVAGSIAIRASGPENDLPAETELKGGSHLFAPASFEESGLFRVSVEHPTLGSAEGNPVSVGDHDAGPRRYWGDFHGQSGETIGTNTAEQYLSFARDRALCDFVSHQGNDFQVTDAFWEELNRLTAEFTEAGRFVAFPGYEWSGLTPLGGDHNVLFLNEGCPIRRSSTTQVKGLAAQADDESPISRLYESLRAAGDPVILFPHIGGRRGNLDFHDPEFEPVIEIHSCWGTFEWFYHDALRRGYRLGVVANSDGHKGRPGTEHPGAGKFGVYGGLTCLLAEGFDRKSFYEALKARSCYGTSGPRILVDATLAGEVVGREIAAVESSLQLQVKVNGTAPIESIDLLAAGTLLKSWTGSPYDTRPRDRVRIRWSGARVLNRNRATVWDGSLKVHDNEITGIEEFSFDTPAHGIRHSDTHSAEWVSSTTGDEDGLLLSFAREAEGTLEFTTGPVTCSLDLEELACNPVVLDAGGVEQRVIFELAPDVVERDLTWSAEVEPSSEHAISGVIPYHLRIRQVDGHRAWTSPWFVRV